MTTFNPSAANAQVRDVTGAVDCSATATTPTANGLTFSATGNAATAVGNALAIHLTAEAELYKSTTPLLARTYKRDSTSGLRLFS
jgi:hypothetical protein